MTTDWKTLLTSQELELMATGMPHWPTAKPSLSLRLLGIFAVGPDADQKTSLDHPEFGWQRRVIHTPTPPIMFEAANRILELEAEVKLWRTRFFEAIRT